MFDKEKKKEQNIYSMLIIVGALFTLVGSIITYGIVNYQLKIVNTKLDKFERILELQYAQIGGEDNYETVLEITKLSKEETTKQLEGYLKSLKVQKTETKELQIPPSTSGEVIEITNEDLGKPIKIGK